MRKEDVYSDVELEIIHILDEKLYGVKVPRISQYSDEDLKEGRYRRIEGFMEVEWTLSRIIRVVDRSYKVICKNRTIVRTMIEDLLRLIEIGPYGVKLPQETLEVLTIADKLLEDLRSSQSYMFREILEEKKYGNNIFEASSDIKELIRFINKERLTKPKDYIVKHDIMSRVQNKHEILGDIEKVKRIDPRHIENVTKKFSNILEEYKDIKKNISDGMLTEYEELSLFVDTNMKLDITYEELIGKEYLLKYMTYLDIGNIMRARKKIDYPIDNPDLLRYIEEEDVIEFYDPVVRWYPITDIDVIKVIHERYLGGVYAKDI